MAWVGFDVHARSAHAAAIDVMTGELTRVRFGPGVEAPVAWLCSLPGRVRACYEAGPTGFGFYRAAVAAGIDMQVIAPGLTPRGRSDRVPIGRAFPSGPSRTHATGVWGASVGAGIAVGPLAAAGLALGWRTGFWVEAAGAGAVMGAAATVTESHITARRRLDLPGFATLVMGMALLTAPLVEARHGWLDATTVALSGAAVLVLAIWDTGEPLAVDRDVAPIDFSNASLRAAAQRLGLTLPT